MIKEFNINFSEKEISLIYQKVKDYPWDSVKDLDGWEHGTNKKYLKELCDYWIISDISCSFYYKPFANHIIYGFIGF